MDVLSINAWKTVWSMTCVVDDLCDQWLVVDDLCGYWPTITYIVYLHVGKIFHLREVSSALVSICRLSTYQVGWMQPDLLFCKDISLVIGIGQSLLTKWQGLIFGMSLVLVRVYWLDDKEASLECYGIWWRRADTSKLLLYQGCG